MSLRFTSARAFAASGRLAGTVLLTAVVASAQTSYDPVVEDPAPDREHPSTALETGFESHGAYLHATFFLASGEGPHPTVIVLHGFPGYEKNFDLAHAIRRAGWNALIFHYRGAWGSEGWFSIPNALEDVAVAIDYVRTQSNEDPRIGEEVAIVGHSLGGFLALMTAASHPEVSCACSIAGVNLGATGKRIREGTQDMAEAADRYETMGRPLAGFSGKAMAEHVVANAERYDLVERAPALASHHLLLIAGERDAAVGIEGNHAPLMKALSEVGAEHVDEAVFDAGHGFLDRRIALARAIVSWLGAECGD